MPNRLPVRRPRAMFLTAFVLSAAACGGEVAEDAPEVTTVSALPARSVEIREPADGTSLTGPAVSVSLTITGLTIAMAGDTTPGTGHHHLFLDRDISQAGQPMPAEPSFIVHMGNGATSYTFEGVPAGEHRLIAVVGNGLHIPLDPWVVDTVRFTVR